MMNTFVLLLVFAWFLDGVAYADSLPHGKAAAINSEVNSVFDKIEAAQESWITGAQGRVYVQVLPSLSPVDGDSTVVAPIDDKKPSDRTQTMRDLGFLDTDKFLADYSVDWSENPQEELGYKISADVEISGDIWRRSRLVGACLEQLIDCDACWYIHDVDLPIMTTTTTTTLP